MTILNQLYSLLSRSVFTSFLVGRFVSVDANMYQKKWCRWYKNETLSEGTVTRQAINYAIAPKAKITLYLTKGAMVLWLEQSLGE